MVLARNDDDDALGWLLAYRLTGNLSGLRSFRPHHHNKVADHGGAIYRTAKRALAAKLFQVTVS